MIDLTDQLLERLVLLGVQLLLEEIEHRRERGLVGRVGLTVPLRLSAGVKRMPRLQRADHLVQLGRSLRRQRALEELSDGFVRVEGLVLVVHDIISSSTRLNFSLLISSSLSGRDTPLSLPLSAQPEIGRASCR